MGRARRSGAPWGLLLALGLWAGGALAQVSLRVEPSGVLALSAPQREYYRPGFSTVATVGWAPLDGLELLGGVSYGLLPASPSSPLGGPSSWLGLGAGLRARYVGELLVPTLEGLAQYVRTGSLDRFGVTAALGLGFRLGTVRLGPSVRLQYVPALADEPQYPTRDALMVGLGLSVEYVLQRDDPAPPPPVVAASPPAAPAPPPAPPVVEHDSDGDGVLDGADACPHVPGRPEEGGCPRYRQIVVTEKKIELKQKIFFAFGLPAILPRSYRLLDEVVQALKDRERICVRIEGHTDAVGTRERNLRLSQERTDAVRFYLTERGIDARALTAKGYGPSLPLDTNATAEGRENNRRVEFVLTPCPVEL